jgi:glucose/arabinose dehydrogenase
MARIVALLVLAALTATPSAALGATATQDQQSPFQQAPAQTQDQQPAAQTTPAPAPVTQTEVDSGSLSTRDGLLIAVGIAALIGGIWFVIARDAKRATAGHVRTTDSALGDGRGGSATRSARRSRRLSSAERKRRKRGRATK